jgi:flagellar biosynthetic protein FliR
MDAALGPTLKLVAGMFTLSIALAAPVILCIVMTELALAILARNLPQMNMLTMGIPIKIVVGLVALSLWFTSIGAVADRIYGAIYSTWNTILVSHASSAWPVIEVC